MILNNFMDKFSPAMDSVHESFTDEQITEFQEAFNLFPQEQKGHIELELLETALKSLGHHPTQVRGPHSIIRTLNLQRERLKNKK